MKRIVIKEFCDGMVQYAVVSPFGEIMWHFFGSAEVSQKPAV